MKQTVRRTKTNGKETSLQIIILSQNQIMITYKLSTCWIRVTNLILRRRMCVLICTNTSLRYSAEQAGTSKEVIPPYCSRLVSCF